MKLQTDPRIEVPSSIVDAIRSFPVEREAEHCGRKFAVSPFDIYATCPQCGAKLKLRSYSAVLELEDVFDAVFDWMLQPKAAEVARQRQRTLEADRDE
jgi:hypothetical protein